MRNLLQVVLPSFLLVIAGAGPAMAASEGRIAGTVLDPDGNPIQGVQVTVDALGVEYQATRTTNKKGKFTLLLLDATKDYRIRLEKDDFVTIEEPLEPVLGDTLRRTWTMTPGQGGGGGAGGAAALTPSTAPGPGKGQAGRLYTEGVEALQAGDLDAARESFRKVAEAQPELPEAHSALAMVYVQQEAFQEALAEASRALELRPGDLLALKIQFEAYRGLGDTDKQEAVLESLIEASPEPEVARLVFNSGVAKIQAGDMEGGAMRFEQARQMDPDLLPVYSALARVYFDLQRYDLSVDMAQQYLAQNPDDSEVLGVLYLTYEQQGKKAEAEETFQALKAGDPASIVGVLDELGVAYFNNGETERAVVLFERVLEAQPDHPQAHYHLALCYLNNGDTARAKELLLRFVELAPDDPEAAVAKEMLASL